MSLRTPDLLSTFRGGSGTETKVISGREAVDIQGLVPDHNSHFTFSLVGKTLFSVGGMAGSKRGKIVWRLELIFHFLCRNAGRVNQIVAIT